MTFKCNNCGKTILKVRDIRDCSRCQSSGRSASIPAERSSSDWITPALIGYIIGSSNSHASTFEPSEPAFTGGGGEYSGAGAGGSYDAPDTPSDSSSSDSGSSDSSSSDSGSSSSDSGGSSSSSDS
jgi:hypothetical protein